MALLYVLWRTHKFYGIMDTHIVDKRQKGFREEEKESIKEKLKRLLKKDYPDVGREIEHVELQVELLNSGTTVWHQTFIHSFKLAPHYALYTLSIIN